MIDKLKQYFIGEIMQREQNLLQKANILVMFYVMVLALALLIPLQVVYLFNYHFSQQMMGLLSIAVFVFALFFMKHRGSYKEIAHGLMVFSSAVFALNLYMYPQMVIGPGLQMACDLLFAFYLLGRIPGLFYAGFHLVNALIAVVVRVQGYEVPFIDPITQTTAEQVFSVLTLFVIMILLIRYYQKAHQQSVEQLIDSMARLQEATHAAEEMNRLKTSFLANMSHEIRTPLNGVLGINQVLSERIEDAELKGYLEMQYTSGRRLLGTLDSILLLSKIEAEQSFFKPRQVSLQRLVSEVYEKLRFIPCEKELEIRLKTIPEEEITVYVDETMLRQVLNNVIGNAIKFTLKGKVEITVTCTAERAVVRVEDTGIGIGSAYLERVFEPFEQESSGEKRSFEGVGLGLAISRRYLELMGGSIKVQSEKKQGSVFEIELPRQQSAT